MSKVSKLVLITGILTASAAYAQPGADVPTGAPGDDSSQQDAWTQQAVQPPGETAVVEVEPAVAPNVIVRKRAADPLATTRVWGLSARATGLSGIGALPGVNYGGELAGMLRHQELFAELAMGRWKPKNTYVLSDSPDHIELGLNVWTVRVGWASMKMPLRGWLLSEVGEVASSAKQMPGVVPRAMMGSTPVDQRWKALGAGFGVAWPMSDMARLFGMVEFAVPTSRNEVLLDGYGTYQPDPLTARSSVGFELGWR
jgi:hypothetical protein